MSAVAAQQTFQVWGNCGFRGKLDTDSRRRWTLIPGQAGQRFRGKVDTDSRPSWTVIRAGCSARDNRGTLGTFCRGPHGIQQVIHAQDFGDIEAAARVP
jgi:hypothetical protein